MSDGIEVVNLDPDQQAMTDEMEDLYEFRVSAFAELHTDKEGEDRAEALMDFLLANNSQLITGPDVYSTDEEAFQAVHESSSLNQPLNVSNVSETEEKS